MCSQVIHQTSWTQQIVSEQKWVNSLTVYIEYSFLFSREKGGEWTEEGEVTIGSKCDFFFWSEFLLRNSNTFLKITNEEH